MACTLDVLTAAKARPNDDGRTTEKRTLIKISIRNVQNTPDVPEHRAFFYHCLGKYLKPVHI